jgi:hypothetical protein
MSPPHFHFFRVRAILNLTHTIREDIHESLTPTEYLYDGTFGDTPTVDVQVQHEA